MARARSRSQPKRSLPPKRSGSVRLIAVATATAALALAGIVAVTLHPALIFATSVQGPGVSFHGTEPFDACAETARDDLAFAAIRADTGARWTHQVYFAAEAPRFQALQRTLGGVRGAYTFNRSAPPFISQSITFRTPDFCNDALARDGAPDIPLKRAILHEIGHSTLRRAIAPADRDIAAWKREGYADRVAVTIEARPEGRCALLARLQRAGDVDAALATLDAYTRTEEPVVTLDDDRVWPFDYALSRALTEQLLEGEEMSVQDFAADPRGAAEVYAALAAACG